MAAAFPLANGSLIVLASPVFRSVLTVICALLLAVSLSQLTLFQRVELWLGDAQQRLLAREVQFEQTLVVDLDEESLRRLEPVLGVWPYKRDIFALVVDYLHELGARVVCFDVLMSERRDGDQRLAQAVDRHPGTVFAAVALTYPLPLDDERRRRLERLSWVLPAGLRVEPWEDFNLPVIAAGSNPLGEVGIASLWPDVDGSVRRIPLFHRAQGAVLPAIALATTLAGDGRPLVEYDPRRDELRLGKHVWPIDKDGRVVLSFPRNTHAVKSISFHLLALAAMGASGSVLEGDRVKGRTVIIGSTALQTDAVHTPRGLMPGAYLLAVAHENLSNDLLLKPSGPLSTALLLVFALTVPFVWCVRRDTKPVSQGASFLLGIVLAYVVNLGLIYWWHWNSPLLFVLTVLLLAGCGQLAILAIAELRRRRHAEAQMRIASAVYEASKEGVFVTDADERIVSINPAFSAITGYVEDEVIGSTLDIFNSGRHDAEFQRTLLQSILRDGYWQGEIWNRRKNGEIFPEWLSINTIRGRDGSIDKRIGIISDLSSNKAAEERISFLANFDPLTALPNRALLRDRVNVALAAASRMQTKVTLMLIDLDRFKIIVDSLGHDIGDRMLQQVAERLRILLGEGDTISRFGGDEFMLLLPGASSEVSAHLAERVLETIARPFLLSGHELNLTASIGIAEFPENGGDHDALSRSADSALYRAKQAGRGNFQFFTEEMHEKAQELLVLENSLRHAIGRDELVLHYQPKVDAVTGQLLGLEVLVRWQHPQRGLVSPAQFIPIAEESGVIRDIGDWVLHTALDQLRSWMDAGLPLVPLAVNLSLAQFRQPSLCKHLIEALQASGVTADWLELELTESVAMDSVDSTIDSIDQLRRLGIGLSIDDFGTGYSSLSYLKRFAVNKIKIDHSFVHNLTIDKDDAAIVRAIISLAHNLGFRVVAEGVETAEQLDFLRKHGCDEIQGFYFCQPLPAGDIVSILRCGVVTPPVASQDQSCSEYLGIIHN